MSTIHDALKKVEQNMQPQNPGSPQTPPPNQPNNPFNPPPKNVNDRENPAPKKPEGPSLKNVIKQIAPWLILCGIIIGIIIFLPSSLKKLNIPLPKLPELNLSFLKKQPKPAPVLTHAQMTPVAQRVPQPGSGPVLQGVMLMGNKTIALINNTPYEVGETFENMAIIDISRNSVTLKDENGEEKILRIAK